MQEQYFDVLIIGAGLSGIGMACHLSTELPEKSYAILERRQRLGGTWDLFRYPGIRSDSDMFTFGYRFRPWNETKVLADGPSIRSYIRETAREYGVMDRIRFGCHVQSADWSSEEACWRVTATDAESGEARTWRCRFLVMGTGYYNYDAGYTPVLPGIERFRGQVIHPQHWPEDLDYAGRNVLVVGSGATAVTLVPAMAGTAGHVTMLQRSPSYIFSVPPEDRISGWLSRYLPERWVYAFARRRNILTYRLIWNLSKRYPHMMRRLFLRGVRKRLGKDFDMTHFSPKYKPWDERLCAVPGGDLFNAINAGAASVVTDQIDTFTGTGVRLKSGRELEADIVITATGLDLQLFGGMRIRRDGETFDPSRRMMYKAVLVEDLPNFGVIFGYVNYPWTLKADIASRYLCRLLAHMDRHGYDVAVPRDRAGCRLDSPFLDALTSGYVWRAEDRLMRQGSREPWRVLNDFKRDREVLQFGPIEDEGLEFESAGAAARNKPAAAAAG
ncbi:MAG TPA: NAD(P)/FAD-dependent oxidoreductase [Gammaproteobacteria bacterium]|nr:NAD(P)/FAD-dependent oxidoreductase [Gammaproteobacteria bacterium]